VGDDEPDAGSDREDLAGDRRHRADASSAGDEEALAGDGESHVLPDEVEYEERGTGLPPRIESWRRRSATGAMLTGFAFGLREVLEPDLRQPAVVLETSGLPPKDLAVEADLDNVPPRQSVVKIRRWLLTDEPSGVGSTTVNDGIAAGETTATAPRVEPGATEIRSRDSTRKRRAPRFGRSGGTR
jgi:hypothetical protein